MCRADNSRVRPVAPGASAVSATDMLTPCWTSRLAIVVMSARSGRLLSTSGSALNRLAAINGKAAFLAPPIGIVPDRGTPPRISILSIVSAPNAGHKANAANVVLVRAGCCFYWSGSRRSSRRLRGWRGLAGICLARDRVALPGLLLAAPQIVAQGARQPVGALGLHGALRVGEARTRGHRRDRTRSGSRCQSLLDAQADLGGEDHRHRLFCRILSRLVGVSPSPSLDPGPIAIDRSLSDPAGLIEGIEHRRSRNILHRVNHRTAPYHLPIAPQIARNSSIPQDSSPCLHTCFRIFIS